MTRCANNDCVKIMCIVSCLWIIGWPLKLMLGYDDNSSLTAYYRRAGHDAASAIRVICTQCFAVAPHCPARMRPSAAAHSNSFMQHDCPLERVLLPQLQQRVCRRLYEGRSTSLCDDLICAHARELWFLTLQQVGRHNQGHRTLPLL